MKISNKEKREIISYLIDKNYNPKISNSLLKKLNNIQMKDNELFIEDKQIITTDNLNEFLTLQYKQFPFGRDKLFKTISDKFIGVSRQDVTNFLKNSQTAQLHKVPPVEKVHKSIISNYPLERFQADLIDLDNIKGFNYNYRYVLTIIDHFSKYAFAFPLTRKTAKNVYNRLNEFFEKYKPHIWQTDNGKEFLNKKMEELLNKHSIKHITSSPYSPRSNGAIERFNRTLKQMIFKMITEKENKHFITKLNEIIDKYNNSYHSTIKNIPAKVFNTENKKLIEETKENIQEMANRMIDKPKSNEKLKRGDFVRISNLTKSNIKADIFKKKYVQNYSKDIYKIIGVSKKHSNYKLMNIKTNERLTKRYYYDQLLKIDYQNLIKSEKLKSKWVTTGKIGNTITKKRIKKI